MPIKKSSLEQKMYYRVGKIILIILPLVVVAFFLNSKIDFSSFTQGNSPEIIQKNVIYLVYVIIGLILYFLFLRIAWRTALYIIFGGLVDDTKPEISGNQSTKLNSDQNQATPIILFVVILVVFVLIQSDFFNLAKLDFSLDDLNPIKKNSYGKVCTNTEGKKGIYGTNGACMTCSAGSAVTNPTNSNCSNGTAGVYCCSQTGQDDQCIKTGCEPGWWCSGYYYIDTQQIRIPGLCFPTHPKNIYHGWTGTCRQCP